MGAEGGQAEGRLRDSADAQMHAALLQLVAAAPAAPAPAAPTTPEPAPEPAGAAMATAWYEAGAALHMQQGTNSDGMLGSSNNTGLRSSGLHVRDAHSGHDGLPMTVCSACSPGITVVPVDMYAPMCFDCEGAVRSALFCNAPLAGCMAACTLACALAINVKEFAPAHITCLSACTCPQVSDITSSMTSINTQSGCHIHAGTYSFPLACFVSIVPGVC